VVRVETSDKVLVLVLKKKSWSWSWLGKIFEVLVLPWSWDSKTWSWSWSWEKSLAYTTVSRALEVMKVFCCFICVTLLWALHIVIKQHFLHLSCTIFDLFDFAKYRDLERWVRDYSKSLKIVPFESFAYGFLFAFHSSYGRIFSRFDTIHERDEQTDRQTDTQLPNHHTTGRRYLMCMRMLCGCE